MVTKEPQFVYFDTNIISHFAKNEYLWPRLNHFLSENNFVMGICEAQLLELHNANSIHDSIAGLMVSVPSGMMKRRDTLLAEEVNAYPFLRKHSLSHLPYMLNQIPSHLDGKSIIRTFLGSNSVLVETRKQQLKDASEMKTRLPKLMENFPPSKSGKYTIQQATKFARKITRQWLEVDHPDFLASFQSTKTIFRPEVFLSAQLYAYVIFYKYYIGQRTSKKISDFGDLFHLVLIPYCSLAVMERDLCETLKQIKRNHNVLDSTSIHNIDFFADW